MSAPKATRWVFISLLTILAIDAISFGLVLPLLPELVGPQGEAAIVVKHPALMQGLMLTIFPLMSMLGTACLGYLSDKWGRKRMLVLSLFGSCVGLGLTSIAVMMHSLGLLLLGRALSGALGASQPLAQATVTDIALPEQKALMLAWVAVAMTVGMLAGPLIGGLLVKPWLPLGLALPFVVSAILALFNACMLVYVFPETYHPSRTITRIPWRHFAYALGAKPVLPKLLAFTLLEFTWSWYFQGIAVVLAPLYHWSSAHTAWVLAGLGVAMSVGLSCLFPLWLKRASVRQISVMSLMVVSLAWFWSLMGQGWIGSLFTAGFMSVGVGIAYTAVLTQLSDLMGRHQQGWLMGVAASLLAVAWALSGLGLGFVGQQRGLWLGVGLVSGLLMLMAYVARFGWSPQASSIPGVAADLNK